MHALALLCKESALVTVKRTEANSGLEAWRGLNATYDSNNTGRRRVRDVVFVTAETFRVDPADVREYEQGFGKNLNEDVNIGVMQTLAAPQVQNNCHLNPHILKSYAQVRTVLFHCCREHADTTTRDAVLCAG